MGIVANGAFPILDRITPMGFLEGFLLRFVALKAKVSGLFLEEVTLIRAVRLVADQAALILDNRVSDFPVELGLFVAGKTKAFVFGAQEVIGFGSVRVVARRAFPLRNSLVDVFSIKVQICFAVTAGTEVDPVLLEDQFSHETMS